MLAQRVCLASKKSPGKASSTCVAHICIYRLFQSLFTALLP